MLEKIIEFLREKPGYRKEGAGRLCKVVRKHGIDATYDQCRKALYRFNKEVEMSVNDNDLDYVSKIKKSHQQVADVSRIERKTWRNRVRFENALTQLNKELIKAVSKEGLKVSTVKHKSKSGGSTKVIAQLSDLHLNELIDIEINKYDFHIAAQRLQKYAEEVKKEAVMRDADTIVVALTGDILNSDRRTDEILNAATNRAYASILATKLIASFILDVQQAADVAIVSVSGNESRIREEYSLDNFMLSDNYDFLIYNMMKELLRDKDGIRFIETNQFETILNVNGANILITHGSTVKKDTQQTVQQIIGKHAVKGDRVDYAIFGHIHFSNVTDIYARSGSLSGANTYADRNLNYVTLAAQNLHIVNEEGDISNLRVNLQNASKYKGYPIKDDYDAYNPVKTKNAVNRQIIKV